MASDEDRGRIKISSNGRVVVPSGSTQFSLVVGVPDNNIKEPAAKHYIELSVVAGRAAFMRPEIIVTVPVDSSDTEVVDIDNAADAVAESSPAGAEVGIRIRATADDSFSLTDDAEGRFKISSTGLVTVADGSLLDFEKDSSHIIVARAEDSSMATAAFTIAVTNVNEITLSDKEVENNLVRASTGSAVAGMRLEATHADGAPITAWELRQAAGLFELTQAAGSATQSLRIKEDARNLSPRIGSTTELNVMVRTEHDLATETFTIGFTEQEPALVGEIKDNDTAANAVAENSSTGAKVGITIQANNATAYTLTDNPGGRFAISNSGLVTVADDKQLNFEDATTHSITVQASSINDRRGKRFTVDVTNVNEITLEDTDSAINTAAASASTTVEGLALRATHTDNAAITGWEITAQTPLSGVDLFEFIEPQDSRVQTLRIKEDADLTSIATPATITLSISVQTAYDEASKNFAIEVSSLTDDGGRLRIRVKVYLEGALE